MKIIEIESFIDFHNEIEKHSSANFIFRGQQNFDWDLIPKIGRDDFKKTIPSYFKEDYLLRSWNRYSSQLLTSQPTDDWDKLSLAQHHGLATRLLDWTKNPLVALYFATADINKENDSAVFILDFNNETLKTDKFGPFDINFSGVFYPRGITARVINQRGVFTISNDPQISLNKLLPNYPFIKLKIKGAAKKSIQRNLEQYGINEFSIYQDLDNLSNYLNRFVLNKELDIVE